MRLFVTGGTGFIGRHFIERAVKSGDTVAAVHRADPPADTPGVDWVRAQLDDVPADAMKNCDALIHFAAHGVADPARATWGDCFRWNVTAALELWQRARAAGVGRFIICGSCFEYGATGERFDFIPADAPLEPTGPYHSSKAAATMAAMAFSVHENVELAVLRPFHVYGEGEAPGRFWPSLRRAALSGEDFRMTDGAQIRDFTEVSVVAKIFHEWAHRSDLRPARPVIVNVGSGHPSSLLEFAVREWGRLGAKGALLPGVVPGRENEVMRYVPLLGGSSDWKEDLHEN